MIAPARFVLTSCSDESNLDAFSKSPFGAALHSGDLWTMPRNPCKPKAFPVLTAPTSIHHLVLVSRS